MKDALVIGEIVSAEFYPDDYPDEITVTVKCPKDTRIGHWHVVMVDAVHADEIRRLLGRTP